MDALEAAAFDAELVDSERVSDLLEALAEAVLEARTAPTHHRLSVIVAQTAYIWEFVGKSEADQLVRASYARLDREPPPRAMRPIRKQ